LNTQSLL
jgi:hypothetical protein